MAELKYVKFLNVLIAETKAQNIQWAYLDSNKELCTSMNWTKEGIYNGFFARGPVYGFNTEDSFYVTIDNTNVVIFVHDTEPARLYVIPPTLKKIVTLEADEYGAEITRLANLVQSQFPSGDQFIAKFMLDEIEEI